ncbi:uncharacterized protein LOC110692181 [Chenopodium quinoa]|uniref:uncharacterized protein LOC110692181 n=1 Tax=Chenopodium quinoa TaxID=63459 RepID=UPI000B77F58A|nr:uncharacterized protein LOC110692181 [Chenopodium quinoa]
MENGIFLVRFRNLEGRDKALMAGPIFFDRKPLIVRKWEAGLNLQKEDIHEVPVWVRLPGLDLKFWGQSALMKIAGILGKPIKTDKATATKELISYARVMVEVNMKDELLEDIEFLDEKGEVVTQKIVYEWKSIKCNVCTGMGHSGDQCPNLRAEINRRQDRKENTAHRAQKVWKPIQKNQDGKGVQVIPIEVMGRRKNSGKKQNPTISTGNRFSSLERKDAGEDNEERTRRNDQEVWSTIGRKGSKVASGQVLYGREEVGQCSLSINE